MRVPKLDGNQNAKKKDIGDKYASHKRQLMYKEMCESSFICPIPLREKLKDRAKEFDISKNDLQVIYCEQGLLNGDSKQNTDLKLTEKLVLLSIKTMQLHEYDTLEIKEAIALHSQIKRSLI